MSLPYQKNPTNKHKRNETKKKKKKTTARQTPPYCCRLDQVMLAISHKYLRRNEVFHSLKVSVKIFVHYIEKKYTLIVENYHRYHLGQGIKFNITNNKSH